MQQENKGTTTFGILSTMYIYVHKYMLLALYKSSSKIIYKQYQPGVFLK